jgi:hypothetical protein
MHHDFFLLLGFHKQGSECSCKSFPRPAKIIPSDWRKPSLSACEGCKESWLSFECVQFEYPLNKTRPLSFLNELETVFFCLLHLRLMIEFDETSQMVKIRTNYLDKVTGAFPVLIQRWTLITKDTSKQELQNPVCKTSNKSFHLTVHSHIISLKIDTRCQLGTVNWCAHQLFSVTSKRKPSLLH